ncbi:hypothetical protein BZZ01_20035 [Nostocales cyanobacterium HT-58-2]|nr:hypothetical protein BZZ01_20035 [Nostocales cyanobacterium HT-58-2]
MEVYLNTQVDLNSAIDQVWRSLSERNQQWKQRQEAAIAQAKQILAQQFQQDLTEVLPSEIQNSLGIQIKQSLDISDISADFEFMDSPFSIKRIWLSDSMYWRIVHLKENIDCQPENLKNQLLRELAKLKNQSNTESQS